MSKFKISANIDEELLLQARDIVESQGLDSVDAVIDKALRMYFANCTAEVWEKTLPYGRIEKLVIKPTRITFESIHRRKVKTSFNPSCFETSVLESTGWKRIWRLKVGV